METILKVIKQEDYDRYVFATYEKNQIVGLNFHQGLDEILWGYAKPCPSITDIYERLADKNHIDSEEKRINKAIELFTNAFIFQDEFQSIDLVKYKDEINSLNHYIETLEHRLRMVKDDCNQLRNFINKNALEIFNKPSAQCSEANAHILNIEIACDLDSNESLSWNYYSK